MATERVQSCAYGTKRVTSSIPCARVPQLRKKTAGPLDMLSLVDRYGDEAQAE